MLRNKEQKNAKSSRFYPCAGVGFACVRMEPFVLLAFSLCVAVFCLSRSKDQLVTASRGSRLKSKECQVRKVAERKFPEFFELSSRILPRILLRIFPRIFRGLFVLRFVGDEDQKKFTKNPRHFSTQNPQANTEKIFTKLFGRAGKVTKGSVTQGPALSEVVISIWHLGKNHTFDTL